MVGWPAKFVARWPIMKHHDTSETIRTIQSIFNEFLSSSQVTCGYVSHATFVLNNAKIEKFKNRRYFLKCAGPGDLRLFLLFYCLNFPESNKFCAPPPSLPELALVQFYIKMSNPATNNLHWVLVSRGQTVHGLLNFTLNDKLSIWFS